MRFSPGTKLGHYEVVEAIGAGGMGEVYRARDTKLGRDVAIKVLPEEFSRDKERLDRFEREARLLAQLNHTNIATLHGLEESGGQQFLVMELVEGETLAERIARGRIPLDEATPLFIRIAEGLEAAHEKGIVHRDLKPANVKIGPDGKPKILDFGLAKALVGEDRPVPDSSQSPTLTKGTAFGVIIGTPSYMSPEQARGKQVDKRADIWAYGCCFYEALTGTSPFLGESVSDTLAAILDRVPEWRALPKQTPAKINTLLRRCLEKDGQRRLRDIGEMRIGIEDVQLGLDEERDLAPRPSLRQRLTAPIIASAVTALVVAFAVWSGTRQSPQPAARFVVEAPAGAPLSLDNDPNVAISPDGSHIVYVATAEVALSGIRRLDTMLYVRPVGALDATALEGTETAHSPFFSPDGEWIGFFYDDDRSLRKIPLAGGPTIKICDAPTGHEGASWGDDGFIVFASTGTGLARVSVAGGSPEVLTTPEASSGEVRHNFPEVLPEAKGVVFTARTDTGASRIKVLDMVNGEQKVLVEGGTTPRFVPTGHLVFAMGGDLMAMPFDPSRLEATGPPVPVLEGIIITSDGGAVYTVSRDGSLVYAPERLVYHEAKLNWVDREGRASAIQQPALAYRNPRISPDGKQLALEIWSAQGGREIWIHNLDRETRTRLTFDGSNSRPVWSPDGSRVAFASNRTGSWDLFAKLTDGSGAAERLFTDSDGASQSWSGGTVVPSSWSQDGNVLAYFGFGEGSFSSWLLLLDEERSPQPFAVTAYNESMPSFSPDGRWVAYVSDESDRDEIYIKPYPGPGGKVPVSKDGGDEPTWSADGKELFFRSGDRMLAVPVQAGRTLDVGAPRVLFEGQYFTQRRSRSYDVHPDGKRFVMIDPGREATDLVIVLNWFEELNRLVPTDN